MKLVLFFIFCTQVVSFLPSIQRTITSSSSSRICLQMLDIDKSETLVYDTKSNRLYEANLGSNDPDEFTLVDEKTGNKILLTRVSHMQQTLTTSITSIYH